MIGGKAAGLINGQKNRSKVTQNIFPAQQWRLKRPTLNWVFLAISAICSPVCSTRLALKIKNPARAGYDLFAVRAGFEPAVRF